MDILELLEPDTDRDGRREAAPEQSELRRGGVRGFFRRWMAAVREDEDSRENDRRDGRRESGFEFD